MAAAVLSAALPAEAGLRVTTRLEIHRQPGGSAGEGASGAFLQFLPQRPVDILWMIQGGSVRSELLEDMGLIPKGTVTIHRAGDSMSYVLNPANRTYYRIDLAAVPSLRPISMSAKPIGEAETIAGRRAEKVLVEMRFAAPALPGMGRPEGTSQELTATEEIWSTGEFGASQDYGTWLDEVQRLLGLGKTDIAKYVKFPLKIRASVGGMVNLDATCTVTSIAEQDIPDDRFLAPPAGYREVPGPFGAPRQ